MYSELILLQHEPSSFSPLGWFGSVWRPKISKAVSLASLLAPGFSATRSAASKT
jgi:hypothetical protein